ncbi:MAG: NAD(P)/FAD-dependent oxidoreductase [Acidimicrobiaceae bacterium]|nr:NAD(P)/FAD-dependent oxidoreductase [Acidimicrobiaceae bacterium]
MSTQRVVIVGGGFAGLSAAYTLKKRGITPLVLEALDRVGGRGKGEEVDGFALDMGAFVFTSTYDTAFEMCEELGLPLVRSQMKFGHHRNGRWVTTTPEQSLWNFVRHLRTAMAMGFGSPAGFRAGSKVMRQMHRQADYLSFASDSPLAEIDDDETYGHYLKRLGVPRSLQLTLGGPLKMVLSDPEPAGQALMRAYIGETMLSSGTVYMPERGIGSFSAALAAACSDSIRVSTPVCRVVVADGAVTGVVTDRETIEADAVICAVPATRVPDLIPDLPAETRRALGTVSYSTGCRVVIGLNRSPLPAGWHGALFPEDDDTPLLLDRSAFLPDCAPAGHGLLDLLIGRDRAEELIPLDDEEIKRQLLGPARRKAPPGSALPGDDEGLFFRVYRWEEALCMGSPGMLAAMTKIPGQLAGSIPNLFLAGDYMGVPSVNGALSSGHKAATRVADLLASRAA